MIILQKCERKYKILAYLCMMMTGLAMNGLVELSVILYCYASFDENIYKNRGTIRCLLCSQNKNISCAARLNA